MIGARLSSGNNLPSAIAAGRAVAMVRGSEPLTRLTAPLNIIHFAAKFYMLTSDDVTDFRPH